MRRGEMETKSNIQQYGYRRNFQNKLRGMDCHYGACTCLIFVSDKKDEKNTEPADLVNPLMGTDSEFRLSNGNTYPAIALPWGMNFWTPQTRKMGNGWGYTYNDNKIMGIKQTHQPSPWINDYAAFSLMAETGKIITPENERASWFSHKAEVAKPYYYSVYLADYDVTAEVTPTERAAIFRFTFPESDSSFILLDAFNEGSMVKIIPSERKVIGYCRNNQAEFRQIFIIISLRFLTGISLQHIPGRRYSEL